MMKSKISMMFAAIALSVGALTNPTQAIANASPPLVTVTECAHGLCVEYLCQAGGGGCVFVRMYGDFRQEN